MRGKTSSLDTDTTIPGLLNAQETSARVTQRGRVQWVSMLVGLVLLMVVLSLAAAYALR